MEIIKKKYRYHNLSAETFNFPIFITQNLFNTGIYTDVANINNDVITGFTSSWDLSYDGSLQKNCKTTNKCQVTPTITNVTSYNGNDGSIVINVTNLNTPDCPGPLEIEWLGPNFNSTGSYNINNLYSGSYTLKIIDADCNRTFKSYYIQQPPALDSDLLVDNSQVNATNNICNGSATVTVTGGAPPYTYAWYSAGTTTPIISTNSQITNICLGSSYYVVVTDSDGTIVTEFFTLELPEPLSGRTISKTDIDCQGTPGAVEVEGFGGVVGTGYTYQLLSGTPAVPIDQNITGIFNNITQINSAYIVRIIDAVGQQFDLYVSITQPIPAITITINSTSNAQTDGFDGDTPTDPDGEFTFSVIGGGGITQNNSVVYNVSADPVFDTGCGYTIENSPVGGGGYALANSTTLYALSSGWYEVVASDLECETTIKNCVNHSYTSSVGITSIGGGKLRASISNPTGYNFYLIKWSDGQNYVCPGVLTGSPCGSQILDSNPHASGSQIVLEVIWVDSADPTNDAKWRTFKRIFKIP